MLREQPDEVLVRVASRRCLGTLRALRAGVDLSDSADQAPGPVNCTLNMAKSGVYCALLSLADGAVMANSGAYRPIEVICREGSIANCRAPARRRGAPSDSDFAVRLPADRRSSRTSRRAERTPCPVRARNGSWPAPS